MKLLYDFLFSLLILTTCNSQTNENFSIEYNADTRGTHIILIANHIGITYVSNDVSTELKLSEHQWNKIINLTSKINLESIESLKAPSSDSATDRALIASLTIKKGGEKYQSIPFDHGNPPSELKKIIELLFRFIQQ